MIVRYLVVEEDDKVRPEDCDKEDRLSENLPVLEALNRTFNGRKVFVWNASRKVWSRVDEATQKLVQDNAALMVIKAIPGDTAPLAVVTPYLDAMMEYLDQRTSRDILGGHLSDMPRHPSELLSLAETEGHTKEPMLSVGGSIPDWVTIMEAARRLCYTGGYTELLVETGSSCRIVQDFHWLPAVREDDSSNIDRVEALLRQQLCTGENCSYDVVTVTTKDLFNTKGRVERSPLSRLQQTKRIKLGATRTDVVFISKGWEEEAKQGLRNVLQKVLLLGDVKSLQAWEKDGPRKFMGQAVGQFLGVSYIRRSQVPGVPVLLTTLKAGQAYVLQGWKDAEEDISIQGSKFLGLGECLDYCDCLLKSAAKAMEGPVTLEVLKKRMRAGGRVHMADEPEFVAPSSSGAPELSDELAEASYIAQVRGLLHTPEFCAMMGVTCPAPVDVLPSFEDCKGYAIGLAAALIMKASSRLESKV